MIIISHRGNLNGVDSSSENKPDFIVQTLDWGFDVEVDLRLHNDKLYLGHDEPDYRVDLNFLKQSGVWVHAKNKEVIPILRNEKDIHWFWHETDQLTLTSRGYIWCFPGYEIEDGIMVDHGQPLSPEINIAGVCTDDPIKWKKT